MRVGIRLLMLGFALALCAAPASVAAQEPADIAGVYHCTGSGADGEMYRGVVTIDKRGETFYVQWAFAAELSAVGIGILDGDALAVTYFGATPGLILYRLDGDRLVGKWTQPGSEGMLYSETLTPVPPGVEIERGPEERRPSRPPVRSIFLRAAAR